MITRTFPFLLAVGLILALGCAGLSEGFQEGMVGEAILTLGEARAKLQGCADSPEKTKLLAITDEVESGLRDGSVSGLEGSMMGGILRSAPDGGCDQSDIEAIRVLYPAYVD